MKKIKIVLFSLILVTFLGALVCCRLIIEADYKRNHPEIRAGVPITGDTVLSEERDFQFESIGTINYVGSRGSPQGCWLMVNSESDAVDIVDKLQVFLLDADMRTIEQAKGCVMFEHTLQFTYSSAAFNAEYVCTSDGNSKVICGTTDTLLVGF